MLWTSFYTSSERETDGIHAAHLRLPGGYHTAGGGSRAVLNKMAILFGLLQTLDFQREDGPKA